MRLVRVRWGRFKLDLPGEILFFLLIKAFQVMHSLIT